MSVFFYLVMPVSVPFSFGSVISHWADILGFYTSGWLLSLAIVSSAIMQVHGQVFVCGRFPVLWAHMWTRFPVLWARMSLRTDLLERIVILCWTFWGSTDTVSMGLAAFHDPISSASGFNFSVSSSPWNIYSLKKLPGTLKQLREV